MANAVVRNEDENPLHNGGDGITVWRASPHEMRQDLNTDVVVYDTKLEMQADLNTDVVVYDSPIEMIRDLYCVVDEVEAHVEMRRDVDPMLSKADIVARLRQDDLDLVLEYELTLEHLRRRGLGDAIA